MYRSGPVPRGMSLLAVVTLRQDGGSAGSLVLFGKSLVSIHDWTFLLGPGWVVGVGNGLILGRCWG